jgi:hypothetical protein
VLTSATTAAKRESSIAGVGRVGVRAARLAEAGLLRGRPRFFGCAPGDCTAVAGPSLTVAAARGGGDAASAATCCCCCAVPCGARSSAGSPCGCASIAGGSPTGSVACAARRARFAAARSSLRRFRRSVRVSRGAVPCAASCCCCCCLDCLGCCCCSCRLCLMVQTQPAMATECSSRSVAIATACRIDRTVARLKRAAEIRRREVVAVVEGRESNISKEGAFFSHTRTDSYQPQGSLPCQHVPDDWQQVGPGSPPRHLEYPCRGADRAASEREQGGWQAQG